MKRATLGFTSRRERRPSVCALVVRGTAGPWQPPQHTTFTVAGQTMSCGPQATVEAELVLTFPGPRRHAFLLDGRELPQTEAYTGSYDIREPSGAVDVVGGGPFDWTTAEPLVFSCAEPARHRVQLITGSAGNIVGCYINLDGSRIPWEGIVGSGKSIPHPISNTWSSGGDPRCDVTWSIP